MMIRKNKSSIMSDPHDSWNENNFVQTNINCHVKNGFAIFLWAVVVGSKGGLMVSDTMWAVAASMWSVTGSICAIASSVSDVAASVCDAQVKCGML